MAGKMKVDSSGLYTYPDVVAVCGEPAFEDADLLDAIDAQHPPDARGGEQAERVVDLARDLAHGPPLHRAEHHVGGAEVQVAELVQEAIHVDRARARLEAVVGDEQDDVVGTGAAHEAADGVGG